MVERAFREKTWKVGGRESETAIMLGVTCKGGYRKEKEGRFAKVQLRVERGAVEL